MCENVGNVLHSGGIVGESRRGPGILPLDVSTATAANAHYVKPNIKSVYAVLVLQFGLSTVF